MTPRSLFIVILRVLGILSIKELFIAIPQLIAVAFSSFLGYEISGGLWMIFISLVTVTLYFWISYTLIFKADLLVTKLGLDQGFSEPTLQLNISISSILRIAIILTGAILLISEIPEFCRVLFKLIVKQKTYYSSSNSVDWSRAVFSGIRIIIGLLIIGERGKILRFLEK